MTRKLNNTHGRWRWKLVRLVQALASLELGAGKARLQCPPAHTKAETEEQTVLVKGLAPAGMHEISVCKRAGQGNSPGRSLLPLLSAQVRTGCWSGQAGLLQLYGW